MSNYKRKEVLDYLTRKPVTTQDIELARTRIQTPVTSLPMQDASNEGLETREEFKKGSDPYNLGNYIDIPFNGQTDVLNFGDEYVFYGNLETDISATIYEMKYLITLGRNQFTNTSNPTWTSGTTSYVTEVGLFDSNKDLILITKLQSPELRQGIQQFVVKLDF